MIVPRGVSFWGIRVRLKAIAYGFQQREGPRTRDIKFLENSKATQGENFTDFLSEEIKKDQQHILETLDVLENPAIEVKLNPIQVTTDFFTKLFFK